MNETCYGNPKKIEKVCEWTGKKFYVDYKHRKRRFIDIDAMYEWRKSQNRETIKCPTCDKLFERYKNIIHSYTGKPTQYCSNECSLTSKEKIQKLTKWGMSDKNHWNTKECQEKGRQTRLKLYGDAYYNNVDKMVDTNMKKYGVPYIFYLPKCKSNGHRISNFQKRIYTDVLKSYPDAKLEEYLRDVRKSVDIFIPSKNKIIECYGDYWHCNPSKCKSNYYNRLVHLTAQEIWNRDKEKNDVLKNAGYEVEVLWENTNKNFKHSTK